MSQNPHNESIVQLLLAPLFMGALYRACKHHERSEVRAGATELVDAIAKFVEIWSSEGGEA